MDSIKQSLHSTSESFKETDQDKMNEPIESESTSAPAILEDLWSLVGGFGRYPILLMAFMCYLTIAVDFQQFVPTYYGTAPSYQCISQETNASRSCGINQCGCVNCTYVFMTDEFSSAVSEWNLICDRAHLKAMTQAVYMTGLLVGSVGLGKISDHFGRKIATFISLFLLSHFRMSGKPSRLPYGTVTAGISNVLVEINTILLQLRCDAVGFGLGSAFANSLTLFAVMRFGAGFASAGCLLVRFVYCMELSTLSLRTTIGIISNLFIMIGAVLLTFVAYMIRDWRQLMLTVALPGAPLLLLWKWIPESFPWLIAKGKLEEAQRVLESFASASRVGVDPSQLASTIKQIKLADASAATEN